MPLVIPVFIPHHGCPHACVFCNQHRISGRMAETPVTPDEVRETVALWLERNPGRKRGSAQAAFYGGSFTGLPRASQQELLRAVTPFMEQGRVQSIRLSTRPDYIDSETAEFLRGYGVTTVELGIQSLDDRVLEASNRGHAASDALRAIGHLRRGGMEIGLQLMLGLPGQTFRSLMGTVKEIAVLKPDFVRIYPLLVLRGSKLYELHRQGKYAPLSLDRAVVQATWMKKYFDSHGIRVVRMGLQASRELEKSLVAGPYHPAFGELVNARILFNTTRKILRTAAGITPVTLSICERDVSIFRGVNSSNIKRLRELGLMNRFVLVTDKNQPRFTLKIIT